MIKTSYKSKSNSPLYLIVIGAVVLLLWMTSCAVLQNTKGYENYPRNNDWKCTE